MNRMYKEQSIQRDRVVYAYQRPMTSGNVAVASHQFIIHLSSLSFTHILRLALSCFMQYAAFSQRSMTERSSEPNAWIGVSPLRMHIHECLINEDLYRLLSLLLHNFTNDHLVDLLNVGLALVLAGWSTGHATSWHTSWGASLRTVELLPAKSQLFIPCWSKPVNSFKLT